MLWPGGVLLALGLILFLPLSNGPIVLGPITFSLNWMLLGMMMGTLGLSMVYTGIIARILFDYSNTIERRWGQRLPYTRTVVVTVIVAFAGVLATGPLVHSYVSNGLVLPHGIDRETHWAAFGLYLIVAAFQTFIFQLMVRALGLALLKVAPLMPDPAVGGRQIGRREGNPCASL